MAHGSSSHDAHDHEAPATRPSVSGPLAYPGALAWLLGIATGVGFLGLLYNSATSHHGPEHGEAAPAGAPAEAAPAAH
jgi:hypothetical protein